MRIYIIRHADPNYDNDTITAAGHKEALALAERLEAEGIDRIYCSPLGRARHTMQYTAERLNRKAEIQDWLQELSGMTVDHAKWGQLAVWDIPGEALYQQQIPKAYDGLNFDEKINSLIKSSDQFLQNLGYVRKDGRYQCVGTHTDRIAVFCHNGFGLTWLAHLLNLPLLSVWTSFWLPPSSVTTILFEQRSPKWAVPRCLSLGDTAHLHKAGLPIQPSGIQANFE
ncbi:MAG: histidine phosphatase family protein [Chloroflexi bacterium]|nr:histidine phosphatase family protein [Chloroflexota bacterium]